jgi:hypothetical protein
MPAGASAYQKAAAALITAQNLTGPAATPAVARHARERGCGKASVRGASVVRARARPARLTMRSASPLAQNTGRRRSAGECLTPEQPALLAVSLSGTMPQEVCGGRVLLVNPTHSCGPNTSEKQGWTKCAAPTVACPLDKSAASCASFVETSATSASPVNVGSMKRPSEELKAMKPSATPGDVHVRSVYA